MGKLVGVTAAVLIFVPATASATGPTQVAACETTTVTDTARVVNWIPPHVGGDQDFAGNGPRISIRASLATGTDAGGRPSVNVHVDMTARETTSDFTTASGGNLTLIRLWLTHPGWQVDGVVGMTTHDGTLTYTDTDFTDDAFDPILANSFVSGYRVVGDTTGVEAGTETMVQINIKPVTLRLSRCT